MIKYIKEFSIYYTPNKKLDIQFYQKSNYLYVTIWRCRKLIDIPGHESEWGTNWWKHIKLRKLKGKQNE